MLSQTSQYALRAMVHVARQAPHAPIPARSIAEHTGVPARYLATILCTLVHAGVLSSFRGKGGGFTLTRAPRKIALQDIVASFEPACRPHGRPFGGRQAAGAVRRSVGSEWQRILENEERYLRRTTLWEAARPHSSLSPAHHKHRKGDHEGP